MKLTGNLLLLVFFAFCPGSRAQNQTCLAASGWTIQCAPQSGTLTISSEKLGVIAGDLRLGEDTPSGIHPLMRFSVSQSPDGELLLETQNPNTAWRITARPDGLTITTTDFHGMLTGWAPSSAARSISNLLDPEGEPVLWIGTDEAVSTYGGKRTVRQSYLPRRDPEVMHMALGHVSGAGMHSLFDRNTDIAIDYGANSALQSDPAKADGYRLTIPVKDSASIRVLPDYFTHTLGVPFYQRYNDRYSPTAPIVWSSWTSYYEKVTEKDVVENTDWLAAHLKSYGFEYVVLDDGYDRGPGFDTHNNDSSRATHQPFGHSWISNWSKERFPHGPEWLTSYIHAKGLKAGVWLVPNAYGPALAEHPDWYLYDRQGRVIEDYDTPALDSSNPQVLSFLKVLFHRLDAMGFDYYKFDGESALPAYAPPVDTSRLYSKSDYVQSFRSRFAVIRQAIGPERFIEECPAGTPLNAIGYVNSYFNGQDLYGNWHGMYSLFSSIIGNLFLNHMVTYVMPGEGLELGEPMSVAEAAKKRPAVTIETERTREDPATGFGVTSPEARTLVTYVALTGVVYPLASVMPELPPARLKLLQETMPTLPILPIDLYSRGTDARWDTFKHVRADYYIHHYPEVLDLKVNSVAGVYDVAADTNWRSEPTERSLRFDELGLPSDRKYVVFDFWQQKPLGVYTGKLDLSIEPHDSRVLFIHSEEDHPQLIGNSRHISGTYSILAQSWNEAGREMSGQSSTMPQQPYTLWFRIPAGYTSAAVQVTSGGTAIPATWKQAGEFASLRFVASNGGPVDWTIHF